MYSYEIDSLLKKCNYTIPVSLYINMIHSSPQINHTKYNPYGNYYESWDTQGAYWKYSIYKD